jgi:hypothetical protein
MCMFEILKKKINYEKKNDKLKFSIQQLIDTPFNKFEKSNQIMKQLLVCKDLFRISVISYKDWLLLNILFVFRNN